MSKQQTAVQWLENQIISELDKSQDTKLGLYFIRFMEVVKQAKAMEKQQIINARDNGIDDSYVVNNMQIRALTTSEQYYNQTFKNESV